MKAIPYRQRIGLLALFCCCGLFLLVCRLAALQVFQHQEWLQQADRLRSGWRPVRALRGEIVDREGRVLAQDAASFELAVLATAWRATRCGPAAARWPGHCVGTSGRPESTRMAPASAGRRTRRRCTRFPGRHRTPCPCSTGRTA